MSDVDERRRIRERKRERLRGDGTANATATDSDAGGAPTEPIHVESPSHFESVVADNDVVLADFYADWCGPCKMLEPVVESVAAETAAAVVKVDVDAQQALAGRYDVSGVPTMYLFADGEPVERIVGVRDEGTLVELIERYA